MKDRAQFWEGPQSSGEEERLERENDSLRKKITSLQSNFDTLEKAYYAALKDRDELKQKVWDLTYSTYNPPDL